MKLLAFLILTAIIYFLSEGVLITEKMITQIIYSSFFKYKKCVLMRIQKNDGDIVLEKKFEHDSTINNNIEYTEETIVLEPLIKKIEEHVPQDNLALLYSNIKTLKLQYNKKLNGAVGLYNHINNRIAYSRDSVSSQYSFSHILGHELYHMASRYVKSIDHKTVAITHGFRQNNIIKTQNKPGKIIEINNDIGIALDEGYTELTTSRTFSCNDISYYQQVKIVKLIELFFDDPQDIENLYFSVNLFDLIKQLELFAPKEEIIELLIDFDNSLRISRLVNGKYSNVIPWLINAKIQLKLYDWFSKKCQDQNKLISFERILFDDRYIQFLISKKNILTFEKNLKNKQKRK